MRLLYRIRTQIALLGVVPCLVLLAFFAIVTIQLRQAHDVRATLVIGAAVAALVLLVNALAGQRLVRRLEELVRCTRRDLLVEGSDGDEIADIERAFSKMGTVVHARDGDLARYRLLFEHAREAILFYRVSDDRIVEVNRAACELYGYDRDAITRLRWSSLTGTGLVHSRDLPIFEAIHLRADGKEFPVEVTSTRATIESVDLMLAVVRNVTDRRHSEDMVRAALQQAIEASRLKSRFVATMSHEIRTPMNAVIGMSELLLDTPLTDEQREFATVLRESGQTLLTVIDDILDFSKIEAGRIELERIDFDLLAVVEGVAALLASSAHAKGISLMTYVNPKMPKLVGDPNRLRQVLVNLIGNGIKFTHAGGVVTLADMSSEHRGDSTDRVTVRFSVNDSGIGIAPEALAHLFDPFRQADGTTTRRYGGTGLGLTISRRIVELMGGKLNVESTLGNGSTFNFEVAFPVASKTEQEPRLEIGAVRVLVIDDDPGARDILKLYLDSWGFQGQFAASVSEGYALTLAAAKNHEPFDLAIVDLRLGEENGFDFLRRVRAHAELAAMRLVMMTAYDEFSQGREAIAAGFSAYVVKPLRQSQLFDCIVRAAAGDAQRALATTNGVKTTSASPAPRSNGTSARLRILLAEDNAVNQRLALRQLEKLGYRADIVDNGRATVDAAVSHDYDLILMDCQMPEMDGFEATREIRRVEQRTGAHVTIVAMTANAQAQDRVDCLAAGMDDYLSKPVSMVALKKIVESVVRPATDGRATDSTVLDNDRLATLFGDDEALLRDFFAIAIPNLAILCDRIGRTADRASLLNLAHELKGAAGNVGAGDLAAHGGSLEERLKHQASDDEIALAVRAVAQAHERFIATVQPLTPAGRS